MARGATKRRAVQAMSDAHSSRKVTGKGSTFRFQAITWPDKKHRMAHTTCHGTHIDRNGIKPPKEQL